MLATLGHFALILALGFSLLQVLVPGLGALRQNPALIGLSKPFLLGAFVWVVCAFFILMAGFLVDDFSISYVANNSNTQLPTIFKISAVWGAHEGSLLLWVLILVGFGAAVSRSSKIPPQMLGHILMVLGFIAVGFLAFILFTSNPFVKLAFIPAEGRELNPLLQDIGLAIHPPMLYMGYVGLAVPFAFVLSALIRGRLDSLWLRWSRPWTLIAWAFLTAGITLGSWWAYYELGWGGWWFWDPVENASFMPWLAATALIHSASVAEKRDAFKRWTVLLAISGFSLSLLGTFLVRSGVLTSVHAFANDPARGLFILIFLVIVVGGSLSLYGFRARAMRTGNAFSPFSREGGLLVNNILLIAALFAVFLGTLYPLLLDALGLGKISVGSPYFSKVFVPIMIPAVFLMAFAPFLRWKKDAPGRLSMRLKWFWVAIFLFVLTMIFALENLAFILGLSLFVWIIGHCAYLVIFRIIKKQKMPRAFLGMILAHAGIGFFILGATATTQFGVEKDVEVAPGGATIINDYRFIFRGATDFSRDNYRGDIGAFEVYQNDKKITELRPEKRRYQTGMPMTEAAIDPSLARDLYVSLGEPLGAGRWSARIYYKPLVRLIWLGGFLIALGGFLAASDRRYRLRPAG